MEGAEMLPSASELELKPPDCEEPAKRSRKPINPEDKLKPILVSYKKKCKEIKCYSCKGKFPKTDLIEVEIKSIKSRKIETVRKVLKCIDCKLKAEMKKKEVKPVVPAVDHICDICGIVKSSKVLIRIHTESHLNLKCMACGAGLSSRCQLLLHLSKHFKNYTCEHCGQNFNYIEKLRKHLQKNHNPKEFYERKEKKKQSLEKGKFPCRFCPYVLNNRVGLVAHEYRLHKDGKSEFQFKCEVCDKGFYTKEDFRIHGFEHFTGRIRYCEVPGCTKFFKTGKLLGIHKKTHMPPKHECKSCGARFVQSSGLIKHNKRFCKFQKQPKAVQPTEETERIATIAKAQYEKLWSKRPEKVKKPFVIPAVDDNDSEGDEFMLQEVLDEAVKIEEKKVENSEFVAIDIKEEPMEVDEENDTWRYEYLDEAIVKIEEIIDEVSVANPVVVLTRLDAHEIQKWTRVKEEKFEMFGFDDDFKLPEVKKARKKYNDGKPRKEGQPKKLVYKRMKRVLKPGEFYTCDSCGNNYTSWVSLHSHVTTVHKPIGDLPCEFCNKLFKASGNLRRHILSIHKKLRPHICHICAKAFSTNAKLTHHLKTHNEPEECEICGKTVRNIDDHLRRHKKSYVRTFVPCNVCGKLYDKNIIQTHIDRVHGKSFNGNIFRCDDCDINYTRREDWRQHNYTTHYTGTIFNCPKCEKVFHTKKLLRYHRHTHDPANIECLICHKTFTRQAGHYKHTRLKHPETVNRQMNVQEETETEIC